MTALDKADVGRQDLCWQQLWAKTDQRSDRLRYHPLLCHMLDVAAVAGLVWDHHLTSRLRGRIQRALGAPDARAVVVFVAGAHDAGKACPGFQRREPRLCEDCGRNDQNRPHGFITAHDLDDLLGCCPASAVLAKIAGGHHGVFPRSIDLRMGRDTLGNDDWRRARHDLVKEFADVVGFGLGPGCGSQAEITDPLVVPVLGGFVSVVDWIGSNQDYFPCAAEAGKAFSLDSRQYWKEAREKAKKALHTLGWLPSVTFEKETQFDVVFPSFTANSLQRAAAKLVSEQASPYLMIVEGPMGQGKTEAGLYAADLAMCRGFARGMYVAMPTQATSNAMFKRVLGDYLRRRGHRGKLNLQLVHGNALLAQMAEVQEGEIPAFKPEHIDDQEGDLEAQSWFTAKKRPLLAPFGVGTIDQSLLSVLQTKHWFVRLFGLAGKVVIFDEVHAYDAYMSTILERLLQWLAELDCTVILVSATLPEAKRKALVEAFSGREDAEHERYPRITLASPRHYPNGQAHGRPVCAPIPMGEPRRVGLQIAKTDLGCLAGALAKRLEHGGCAAVVCNTVDRSIEVYRHLRENLRDTECSLFHARTLRMWRREREEEVLRQFGKRDPQDKDAEGRFINPDRPHRAVLVATQVIEQSLDLDFDLMVSEIAPMDLLLQRSGRLHRHPRHRPPGLESPQLIVLCDADRTGSPPVSFSKAIEYVYDRHILLLTWLALRGQGEIEVPAEIEALVEAVYGDSAQACDDDWEAALADAKDQMQHARCESEKAASRLLVCQPKDPSDLIEDFNQQLADEENPEVHRTIRAATRQGPASITVVVLSSDEALVSRPDSRETRRLLDRSVSLSHAGVFRALLDEGELPREWAQNAHLRHARLLRLDDEQHGRIGPYTLAVDEHLGVVIDKDGGSDG